MIKISNSANKKFMIVAPYVVILIVFIIYMHYWSGVAAQCTSFCSRGYDDFAYYGDFLGLLDGSWPGDVVFYQSPLPGFYLGLVHAIFQHPVDNLAIPYLIQIFLVTITCAMAYKLAEGMFSRYVGIITVLLLGFYEFVKFYATTIEANILAAFFLTATLYFLSKYEEYQNKILLVVASACLGIAVLSRMNNLVIIGGVVLWLISSKAHYWRSRENPLNFSQGMGETRFAGHNLLPVCAQASFSLEKPNELTEAQNVYAWVSHKSLFIDVSILCATTLLILSPAIVHSSLAAGKPVLVTMAGEYNFTMGNLPGAPGTYWNQATHSIEPSIKFITEQPVDWLFLIIRKSRLFFTFPWSPARFHELNFYFATLWSIFAIFYFFYFFKTFLAQRSLLHFVLIFYAASIIITHVEDEYRLPILPVIFIFVSITLINLAHYFFKSYNYIQTKIVELQIQKPVLFWGGAALVIVTLVLQIPDSKTFHKVEVDYVEREIAYGGIIVGQNFQVDCPNLNQIEVKMFSPTPDNFITFYLKENSPHGPEIYSQEINTSQLASFSYYRIDFPEIADSAGKSYIFFFDTANLKSAEEGIVFAGGQHSFAESLNRIDFTKRIFGGAFISLDSSFVNSENLDGNLVFSTYCNSELPSLIEFTIDRLAQKTFAPQIVKPLLIAVLIASCVILLTSLIFIIYKGLRSPGEGHSPRKM